MLSGISILIGLAIAWLTYSRYAINKQIGKELVIVEKDTLVNTDISIREFARYARSHNLRCDVLQSIAIIYFEDKIITIVEKDDQTILYIQD